MISLLYTGTAGPTSWSRHRGTAFPKDCFSPHIVFRHTTVDVFRSMRLARDHKGQYVGSTSRTNQPTKHSLPYMQKQGGGLSHNTAPHYLTLNHLQTWARQFNLPKPAKTMTEKIRLNQEQYEDHFFVDEDVAKAALAQALEIRKFEIELYWKRATYFWTFIGATFVAYGVFYNSTANDKSVVLTLISCIGCVFSLAWHCVNKGSKFWQENWENHVALLEDDYIGPLYKSRAERSESSKTFTPDLAGTKRFFEYIFVDPAPFSVSKINQLVSTFVAIIWILILCSSIGELNCADSLDFRKAVPVTLTFLTCLAFWLIGKSHPGNYHPDVFLREVSVSAEKQSPGKTTQKERPETPHSNRKAK